MSLIAGTTTLGITTFIIVKHSITDNLPTGHSAQQHCYYAECHVVPNAVILIVVLCRMPLCWVSWRLNCEHL